MSVDATLLVSVSNQTQRLGRVDLTNEEYHGGKGISKSHLDVVAQSPAHYWQAYINPDRKPREETPAFLLGSLIHSAILEPDLFEQQYIVVPEHAPSRPTERQRNAAKPSPETVQAIAWWDWFDAANAGRKIVTPEQYAVALGARDSVFKLPAARKLLSRGKAEQSYFAIDPEFGELVKCRCDWDALEHGYILDVKSTLDASPDHFVRSVLDFRYHVQEPWYQDVIEAALDSVIPKDWYFLAVEKTPPYAAALYTLPKDVVAAGRVQAGADLFRIHQAKKTGQWPSYNPEPTELVFPGWARRKVGCDSPEAEFA